MRPNRWRLVRNTGARLHASARRDDLTAPLVARTTGLRSGSGRLRHHLHRGIGYRGEEAVENGSMPQQLPARARGLAEDDVGDALALREGNQPIGGLARGDTSDRGTQWLRRDLAETLY